MYVLVCRFSLYTQSFSLCLSLYFIGSFILSISYSLRIPESCSQKSYFILLIVIDVATSIISSRVNLLEATKNSTPSFSQLIDVSVIAPIVKPKSTGSPVTIQVTLSFPSLLVAA